MYHTFREHLSKFHCSRRHKSAKKNHFCAKSNIFIGNCDIKLNNTRRTYRSISTEKGWERIVPFLLKKATLKSHDATLQYTVYIVFFP